jgi:hypothetical protein
MLLVPHGSFREGSVAGCGEGVGLAGDDDPGGYIDQGTDAGAENQECCDDAGQGDIPAIAKGEGGTDSPDHAAGEWARELAGVWRITWRRSGGGDGGSAGGAETGGLVELIAALRTVHGLLREDSILPHGRGDIGIFPPLLPVDSGKMQDMIVSKKDPVYPAACGEG